MKTKYLFIFCMLILSIFNSCKESYLDTLPTSQVKESELKTIDDLETALYGINGRMYQYRYSQGFVGEANINIVRDMLGEDVINSTTGNGWFISESRWISHRNENTDLCYYPYYFYYNLILNANLVLGKLENVVATNEQKSRIKGECIALRGWAKFQLVQLYAKRYENGSQNTQVGIVINDLVSLVPKARSTVEETYTSINNDVNEAIKNLEISSLTDKNRITLKTVYGIKARIALTQQNWIDAEIYSDKAINTCIKEGLKLQKGVELITGFNNMKTNTEWMWSYTQTNDQNLYFGSFLAYMSWNYNSTNIRTDPKIINSKLYNTMPATDIRTNWWDPTGKLWKKPTTSYASKAYETHKFSVNDYANSTGDLLLMRMAEMYLIKTEAQTMLNKFTDAQQTLYDLVSTRNPAYTKSSKTGTDLIGEILIQRRLELWGEGFRFTDLKRLNLPLDRNGANTISSVSVKMSVPAGDKEWQFLIPKSEINASPIVIQNEL